MRLLRISIGGSVAGIAVAAIGLSTCKDLSDTRFLLVQHVFIISVMPMACLLVWGLIIGYAGLIRRGERPTFLVGFEVFGWAALFFHSRFRCVHRSVWDVSAESGCSSGSPRLGD